jgi:hypothetical protein
MSRKLGSVHDRGTAPRHGRGQLPVLGLGPRRIGHLIHVVSPGIRDLEVLPARGRDHDAGQAVSFVAQHKVDFSTGRKERKNAEGLKSVRKGDGKIGGDEEMNQTPTVFISLSLRIDFFFFAPLRFFP